MSIMFICCWILISLCVIFGIYKIFKKEYDIAIGNSLIPIFLVIFYFLTALRLPGSSALEQDEITYFVQQVQNINPFAIFTLILLVMFIILLIWDIKAIRKNIKKV